MGNNILAQTGDIPWIIQQQYSGGGCAAPSGRSSHLKPLVTRSQSKTKTITSASINPAGPGAAPSDLDGAAPSPVGFMDAVAIVVVFRVISDGKWFRMSGSLRNETKMKTQSRSEGKMTTLLAASHG